MVKHFAVAAVFAACSLQALAWGPREQGALAGLVGGYIIGRQAPPAYYPPPLQPVAPMPQEYYQPRYYSPPRPTYREYHHYYQPQPVCQQQYIYNNGQLAQQHTISR